MTRRKFLHHKCYESSVSVRRIKCLFTFNVYVLEENYSISIICAGFMKFQTSTRDLSLPHVQNPPRPMEQTSLNEPEFATS